MQDILELKNMMPLYTIIINTNNVDLLLCLSLFFFLSLFPLLIILFSQRSTHALRLVVRMVEHVTQRQTSAAVHHNTGEQNAR